MGERERSLSPRVVILSAIIHIRSPECMPINTHYLLAPMYVLLWIMGFGIFIVLCYYDVGEESGM